MTMAMAAAKKNPNLNNFSLKLDFFTQQQNIFTTTEMDSGKEMILVN